MNDFCRECGKSMPPDMRLQICDSCVRVRDERRRLSDMRETGAVCCVSVCQGLTVAVIVMASVTAVIQWIKFSWNL